MSELNLVLLGPPGAGKGTQAERLREDFDELPYIATGDEMRARKSDPEIAKYMEAGELVPDDVVCKVLLDRVDAEGDDGFLLDGFPRTLPQVSTLDECLDSLGGALDAVVQLVADADEVVDRLLKRAQTQGRSDDTEEVIRTRLEVYREQTHPLVAVYAKRGVLVSVDAVGGLDEVTERIFAALDGGVTRAG